ncbi:MAG: pseudouridine synthase [Candidatus Sulfotelmatobacter sp.]
MSEDARKIGLARMLSKLGYCSRSRAAELIRAGRASLNGKIRRNPETPVSGRRDKITVDATALEPQPKIYLMLNKPRGIVTTAADDEGRETVYGLLRDRPSNGTKPVPWVAPVGRLDKASEGLLLLTNDSEWGSRIASPHSHLDKTYHVQVAAIVSEELLLAIVRGITANNGEILRAKQARCLRSGQKNCWVQIILDEGRNRQIRRMFEAFGIEVLRLIRVAIGPLTLGNLAKGEYRPIAAEEKRMLDHELHPTML